MTILEVEALFDTAGDATPKLGWSLVLRSPYQAWEGATSWLGGTPAAPQSFKWPLDKDGSPLTFLAQIDLACILTEQSSGERPAGLPISGSLLVFVGQTYACRVLTETEMREAAPRLPPAGLPAIKKHGFFGDGQMLVRWPVSPQAFFDKGHEGKPDCFPDRFAKVETWIINWGIATLEAELALACLTMELRQAHSFTETQHLLLRDGRALPTGEGYALNDRHYDQILKDAPDLVSALTIWCDHARTQPADSPVDSRSLASIFEKRMAFVAKITGNYRSKFILPGNPQEVWRKLTSEYQSADPQRFFQSHPYAYRPFIEAYITDWRGHRLFGIEPPFPNNSEDLRGHGCLISIAADSLLDTCSEHEYGMSVWCPTKDMARGRIDRGQFVRHCAV